MTVKTTLKFTADLGGAVEAGIVALQTAAMCACNGHADERERLEKLLAELRAIERQVRGSRAGSANLQ